MLHRVVLSSVRRGGQSASSESDSDSDSIVVGDSVVVTDPVLVGPLEDDGVDGGVWVDAVSEPASVVEPGDEVVSGEDGEVGADVTVAVAVDPDDVSDVDEPPDEVVGPVSVVEPGRLLEVVVEGVNGAVVGAFEVDAPLPARRREERAVPEAPVVDLATPMSASSTELTGSSSGMVPEPVALSTLPSSNRLRLPYEPGRPRPFDSAEPLDAPADTTPTGSAVPPSEPFPVDRTRPTRTKPETTTATTFRMASAPDAKCR